MSSFAKQYKDNISKFGKILILDFWIETKIHKNSKIKNMTNFGGE